MPETKQFSLRTVLSVTTGRFLCQRVSESNNGIQALYELLGWMTNDEPFTHQLPRFSRECQPWLLRWFPDLQKATDAIPELDSIMEAAGPAVGCAKWIEALIAGGQPTTFDVPRIPQDDHDRIHPLRELVDMRGGDEGIVVVEPN
jgi:hypothetical protein